MVGKRAFRNVSHGPQVDKWPERLFLDKIMEPCFNIETQHMAC